MPLIIPDSLYSMFSPKEATSISCLAEKYNKGVPLFSLKGEKMSQCVFFFFSDAEFLIITTQNNLLKHELIVCLDKGNELEFSISRLKSLKVM